MKIRIFKQQPQKAHKQDILPKNRQIDRSFFAFYGTHAMNHFASLGILMCQGRRQDAEVTKSLPSNKPSFSPFSPHPPLPPYS